MSSKVRGIGRGPFSGALSGRRDKKPFEIAEKYEFMQFLAIRLGALSQIVY
jgi:hypothetical protein